MIEVRRRSFGLMSAVALHPKAVDLTAVTYHSANARCKGRWSDDRYKVPVASMCLGRQDRRVVDLEGSTYLIGPLNISEYFVRSRRKSMTRAA